MARHSELQESGDNPPSRLVRKHRLSTRLWHWINAAALLALLMSGLMIFNAHPRLYWGEYGSFEDAAWLEIVSDGTRGAINLGSSSIETTGLLGIWTDGDGIRQERAFPYWATIPSGYDLAAARRWHFFFAWIFALALTGFMLRALLNGHIARQLHIRREQWSPAHIWREIKAHLRLRPSDRESRLDYNILQKFSYIAVIFLLLPLMIFTGLAMSPGMNAAWPWLVDIFGGRQSARSVHFIAAFLLLGFFVVHLAMVLLAGPVNGLRAMITGWYRLPEASKAEEAGGKNEGE